MVLGRRRWHQAADLVQQPHPVLLHRPVLVHLPEVALLPAVAPADAAVARRHQAVAER